MSEESLDRQILASALFDPNAIEVFKDSLNPDAVGKPVQSFGFYQLYSDMVKCHNEIGELNPGVFMSWLEGYPKVYESIGGTEAYTGLVSSLESIKTLNPLALVKLAHRRLGRTQTLKKIQELQVSLGDDLSDDDVLEELAVQVQERIRAARPEKKFNIRTALEIAQDAEDLWNEMPFIPTQYKGLNEALGYDGETGGVMRGNIYSVVATSGLGKSTLVKSMCNFWLDTGYTVLFVNFEEAQDLWERVLMTQVTEENSYKKIPSDKMAKVTQKFRSKMEQWGERLMVRHDPDSLFYEDLEKWLRDLYDNHADKHPDIVVIDTIQSLFTKSGGGARWGDFEYMMVRLEKLAKDMNAVFLLTVQQNSNALREGRTVVNQSDIGGSVTIVQKSTVAMVLMPRKNDIDIDTWGTEAISDIIEIHMPKNRITGTLSKKNPPLIRYDDDHKLYYDWSYQDDKATTPATPFNIANMELY